MQSNNKKNIGVLGLGIGLGGSIGLGLGLGIGLGGSIGLGIGTRLGLVVSEITLFEKHLPPPKKNNNNNGKNHLVRRKLTS